MPSSYAKLSQIGDRLEHTGWPGYAFGGVIRDLLTATAVS